MAVSFVGNLLYDGGSPVTSLVLRSAGIGQDRPHRHGFPRKVVTAFCKASATNYDSEALSSENGHNAATFPASRCACCGRRSALGLLAGVLSASSKPNLLAHASSGSPDAKLLVKSIRGTRPEWYERYFAAALTTVMQAYEMQVEDQKIQLFNTLGDKALDVLELGVGTGPNFKYYAKGPEVHVIGVDPNQYMEEYAQAAAAAAGLQNSQFDFVQGVGEALPIESRSVDAVICTLVLCSVKDMAATLKEVKRVLKPGGSFLFLEHVAAPEGTSLRFWQDFLNPLQQLVADGCHLNRNTLDDIQNAKFDTLEAQSIVIPNLSLLGPHIVGTARV